MRRTSSLPLAVKLPLILALIVIGVATIVGAVMIKQDRRRLEEALRDKALTLGRSIAVVAAEPLLKGDSWTLYKSLRQIAQGPDGDTQPTLLTAMIVDSDDRVLAHIDPAHFQIGMKAIDEGEDSSDAARRNRIFETRQTTLLERPAFVESLVPVQASNKVIGLVRLRLSTSALHRATLESSWTVSLLTITMAALIGSLIGIAWTIRTLTPLRTLAESMSALGRGQAGLMPVSRDDEIGQLMLSFNRMSEELEQRRKLAAALAAKEKVVALGTIAAGVAHEVNNPLAGMLNCLSTLRLKENEPALVARYLPLIEKGLKRIEALVKDLLAELRVDDASEIGDAASCIEDIRDLISAEIEGSAIELSWENDLNAGEKLNQLKVQQILLNLMRNAVQAMPQGGRLSCKFRREAEEFLFIIEDTGHGIPNADLPKVFDPFFTSRPSGTGLGLWIVLRLTQSLNGRVDVSSELGRGTCFQVRLPCEMKYGSKN